MKDLAELDFTATVKDYDYTMRAMMGMDRVLSSEQFAEMDSDAIFNYLIHEMEIVTFSDYLKRYIYERAGFEIPFANVTDEMFMELIISNFEDKGSPYSMTQTTRRRSTIVKAWVENSQCSRDGVFALAFGLNMTDEDVSMFLTKVLKEEDFDFDDARETVFWSCLHRCKGYRYAKKILEQYESLDSDGKINQKLWDAMRNSPQMYLISDDNLIKYLSYLKASSSEESRRNQKVKEFQAVYDRVCDAVSSVYYEGELENEINPVDIEKALLCGVPMTGTGNIQKISKSLLSSHFQQKLMTRQRLNKLINGQQHVDRFDLITLLFLIYALTVAPEWPTERALSYIDEINEILNRCGMMDIYPVNPYEAFILMCMLTDYPLSAYSEVMELSYDVEERL